MDPKNCRVGMTVLYEPSPGHKFRGTVAYAPWQLASGHWVTKLVSMEPGYAEFTNKSSNTVHAAALARIEPANGG